MVGEAKLSMIPLEFYYPIFTLFMFALTIAFVPRQKYAPLFWGSLFWGFFLSIVFAITLGTLFGLFYYAKAYPFVFLGSPIWLNVAWLGAIMLYLRFLPTRKVWYAFPVYLLIFAFASMILDMVFNQIGLLVYTGWNPIYRLIAGVLWFYGAAKHQWNLEEKEIKEKEDEAR